MSAFLINFSQIHPNCGSKKVTLFYVSMCSIVIIYFIKAPLKKLQNPNPPTVRKPLFYLEVIISSIKNYLVD